MTTPTIPPLRWGILGAANIALQKVIPAIQRSRHGAVVAIASRDAAKARLAADALGIVRAYGSYDALLADADVDAVYNPLPNHLHVPWSARAAEAGKHVLCEKPIAPSAAEARELLAVRDRTGVVMAEAFMVRAHPQWHAVRDLVRAGRIGELRLVAGHFSYYKVDPTDVRSRREWGGGALLDIGGYPVTLSRWLYEAEPRDVAATIEWDPALGVDRLASGLLRFDRGQATFTCGGQLVAHQRMQLFGTTGRIDVAVPFTPAPDRPTRIVLDDGRELGGAGEAISVPAADQYALQADRFAEAVHGAGEVPVSIEDAVANMAVLDALFRAGESGRWEEVVPVLPPVPRS